MNIRPLLDALDLQEEAARALADDLRAQIDDLQTRLREAETHLEHLTITRKTVIGLADRLPASAPDLPSTRTTPASSPPSTTRPGRYGPRTSAQPSATNCCRRTSKAPAPS
ncbi:hypothetical protein N8I84_03135 [Streptomyces cynarae]|uniref:Uncharacterized protein n=1 Tax=Streptomyces cynarae TaxID=2981134 RepID=A0ABY6DTZ1_9ACTN|nr:hypothetical protein [Streptomyces cynarae]UXY17840.1 hypothetical protein N8I84_03135 [Streptomyces cynarae]